MADHNVPVNRTLAGILTILCALAGVVLCVMRGMDDPIGAGFIRVSLVLGALWLALPTQSREAAWARVSPWAVVGVILVAVLVVRNPRVLLPVVIALSAVGYFLRPRKRRGPR